MPASSVTLFAPLASANDGPIAPSLRRNKGWRPKRAIVRLFVEVRGNEQLKASSLQTAHACRQGAAWLSACARKDRQDPAFPHKLRRQIAF
jgi:hypothetical protein